MNFIENGPVGTYENEELIFILFEPEAPALQGRCSTGLSYKPIIVSIKFCEKKMKAISMNFTSKFDC